MVTVEGHDVNEKVLMLLVAGETPVFAARPSYATVDAGAHWDSITLLLTDRRLIFAKDRLFGKAKADFEAPWADVRTVEGSLWNGGGPQIQLLIHVIHRDVPIELIVPPQHAVDVESAIRTGYLGAR
jgi:hypothetical protein